MNFVKLALDNGGRIRPIIIDSELNRGLGIMNPSIYDYNGKLIVNLRAVNYTFYHSEKKIFQHPYGPLTYLHPENDVKLRTWNYYLELDDDYNITRVNKIDTSKFTEKELWEFIGLEDARIFEWEGKLYTCGVRRDLDTIGTGRMELCEIEVTEDSVVELSRFRIPTPGKDDEYCSKNWMPILDKPYHFVKWSNPTEIVKVNPESQTCETVFLGQQHQIGRDIRGGSQVIPWRDYYVAITHEVDLFKSETGRKDAVYKHRILFWDKNFNLVHWTNDFSIMGGDVEFCVGLTKKENNFIMTYGFQDNAAYLLEFPEKIFDDFLREKTFECEKIEENKKYNHFDWGPVDEEYRELFFKENFIERVYEKHFEVQENDVVMDLGANCGSFTFSIFKNKPNHVYCIEPSPKLVKTLQKNILNNQDKVTIINKAVSDQESVNKKIPDNDVFVYCHEEDTYNTTTFKNIIKNNNISTIDFLKCDCEGGEYFVFTEENVDVIKSKVKRIAGEFHITGWNDSVKKFKVFRDNYLKDIRYTDGLHVYERCGTDVTQRIFDDQYLEEFHEWWNKTNPYFGNFMVYVDYEKSKSNIKITDQEKDEKWKSTNFPTIEFTTSIDSKNGCVVDCVFCPQRTLQKVYKGERFLSLENFKKCVNKIPQEVRITFAGFTEPWLNPKCTDMLLYANEKGHQISVFTTGIGMTIEDLERIKDIKFAGQPNGGFTLHLPDQERKAKHPITKKYVELIERMGELREHIQNFNVMTMGTVHESVSHVFPEAPIPKMWSRAGNLFGESLMKPELINRKDEYKSVYHGDKPKTCGCIEKLYHNVVLPNGDVSLCCMDYGLEHIIGNLLNQSYEEIMPANNTCFNLCRFCENGVDPNV